MGKNQHVTKNSKGGWNVLGTGNKKPSHIESTKAKALEVARGIAKNQKSEVVIHGLNGRIQDKDSYGNDSCPPKDTVN